MEGWLCDRWWVWMVLLWCGAVARQPPFGPQCEEIRIPMCRRMPYNFTRLPNLLHHSTQENAQLAVEQFEVLRWTRCSSQLEFFLCSMYVPICTLEFGTEAIPPCRSVCEAARAGCEPLLRRFDIPWPSSLACTQLPEYDSGVCITPDAIISTHTSTASSMEDEAECGCDKIPKLRQKVYKRSNFDYVLRGRVRSVESFGGLTLTTLTVAEVVRTQVMVVPGADAHLWTNRSCACPPLLPSQDYLLLGWEDVANNRLLYLPGSIAVPYKRRYVRKIRGWDGYARPYSHTAVQHHTTHQHQHQPLTANATVERKSQRSLDGLQAPSNRKAKRKRNKGRGRKRRRRRRKKQQPDTDTSR